MVSVAVTGRAFRNTRTWGRDSNVRLFENVLKLFCPSDLICVSGEFRYGFDDFDLFV